MKSSKFYLLISFLIMSASFITAEGQNAKLNDIEYNLSQPQLVLDVGNSGEFDSLFVSDPCVLKVDVKYLMYYTGYGDDENSRIGLAESNDGKNWTKKGMVLDSGILTDLGVIDLMEPCVIIDEAPKENILKVKKGTKIYRMWYAANTHEDNFIFYAESLDGINWKQKVLPVYGKLNGEKRVREPWIIKYQGSSLSKERPDTLYYLMWYTDGENENLLKSNDGLKWHYIGNFIRAGEKGHWTSRGVHLMKVFYKNNEKYFLFNGNSGNDEENIISQIGAGLLSKDNKILKISEEPIIGNDEVLYRYGAGSACAMYEDGKVKIWYSGMNSSNPNDEEFLRIFYVEGELK